MQSWDLILALTGALVLLIGLVSVPVERLPLISRPLLAMLVGILVGPAVLNLLNPAAMAGTPKLLFSFTEKLAAVTVSVALMETALRLPHKFFRKNAWSLFTLLGLIMPAMWLCATLLLHFLLHLPWMLSLLIGAIITPTDPVLSSAIVKGKIAMRRVDDRVRHLISAESGANDGLAFAFVLLALLMQEMAPGEAAAEWVLRVLLWEIMGALLVGAALGAVMARLFRWGERHETAETTTSLSYTFALTLLTLGVTHAIQINEILAVFIAGRVMAERLENIFDRKEEHVQQATSFFFTMPTFAYFGLILPWEEWRALGFQGALLLLAVLLLRRLLSILLLRSFAPIPFSWREGLFLGWFGPVGIAALYYVCLSIERTGHTQLWTYCSLVIFLSVVVHGATAGPFTALYDKSRRGDDRKREQPESAA